MSGQSQNFVTFDDTASLSYSLSLLPPFHGIYSSSQSCVEVESLSGFGVEKKQICI